MMVSSLRRSAWPPFPIEQLPSELQGLMDDFQWAAQQAHPPTSSPPVLTVVVPCFNPDPHQFAQLLLSLLQQSDQAFDVLLVNDGSSDDAWLPIQAQLDPYPWIQVLHQSGNTGISAALNAALDCVATPYVALVDQDDILHPGALACVHRHLNAHPDCGLLYTDHLVFDDAGTICQSIAKFPWNPETLLEFNFLIHLTVVKSDLYRACGGMNTRFDGIQDWEFYLRLTPYLTDFSVGYLPLPLYAWRLSDRSVASSARPKDELLGLAREFLVEAHARWQTGCRPALPHGSPEHYRFLIDHSSLESQSAAQLCHVLVLAPAGTDPLLIRSSLQSIVDAGLPMAGVFVAHDDDLSGQISGSWPEPTGLTGSLADIAAHLPDNASLLVLQAGVCLRVSTSWCTLHQWLEQCTSWDVLTFPGFDADSGLCVSAGYSSPTALRQFHIPQGQGLSAAAFTADFASFAHTRAVDLPSPSIQFLRSGCVYQTLEAFRISSVAREVTASRAWWSQFAMLSMRCACWADLTVDLTSSLAADECSRVAVLSPAGFLLRHTSTWIGGAEGARWIQSYGQLVAGCVLEQGAGRAHPSHVHAFLAQFQHPAVRHAAEQRPSRFSLLPPSSRRPVVLLIPTELNARSNGHACLLTLAAQLQDAGQDVYLLPFKPHTFFRHYLSRLPSRYRHLSFISGPSEVPRGVLLAPESAPVHLVNRLRRHFDTVIWWLLAPSGVLTYFRPDIRIGDKIVAFSEFALPNQSAYLFVHPPTDPFLKGLEIQYAPQSSPYPQVSLYTGKGRLKALPRSLHRYLLHFQVVLITRSFPATKTALLRLLDRSKGLISCDPMTNLSLEAANLGVPTFLVSDPFLPTCYTRFPVDLSPWISSSPGYFLSQLQRQGPRRKLPSDLLYRATKQATMLMQLLSSDPEPHAAHAFRVTHQTIQELESYRSYLLDSQTIQIARDGQSASSAFTTLYIRSLKAPYVIHFALCQALAFLDQIVDLLVAARLFRVLKPLLHQFARCVYALERRFL